MKELKTICDLCRKEKDCKTGYVPILCTVGLKGGTSKGMEVLEEYEFCEIDICEDCAEKLGLFVKEMIENKGEK